MNLIPLFIRKRIAHRPTIIKIVDNIGWLFVDKILRMGIGLIVGVWIARYLGPEQFGLLNYAIAFTGLFGAIAGLGLQGIVVRDIVHGPDSAKLTLGTAALLQIIGGLVSFLLILAIVDLLRPDDAMARGIVAILGSVMLFKASEIAVYWFESQVQSKYTVWVQNSVFLTFACIKVILILQHASLIAFAWAMLIEAVVVAVILVVVLRWRGLALNSLCVSVKRARELLRDAWPLILTSTSVLIYMKIDQIMLGQMIGDDAVGIYSSAVRISEIWYFVAVSINASLRPRMYELKRISHELFLKRLKRIVDLMIWVSVPIALITMLIAKPLVETLYGAAYGDAAEVLSVHVWAGIFVFINNTIWVWYLAENQQRLANIRLAIGLLINIILNYYLIPPYGIMGAAWATLISRCFVGYFGQLLNKKTWILFFMITESLLTFGHIRSIMTRKVG